MTTPHRVALCALLCFFAEPPEEAQFQLPLSARLALGAFLAAEAACADGVREPTLAARLQRLENALGDAAHPVAQARALGRGLRLGCAYGAQP